MAVFNLYYSLFDFDVEVIVGPEPISGPIGTRFDFENEFLQYKFHFRQLKATTCFLHCISSWYCCKCYLTQWPLTTLRGKRKLPSSTYVSSKMHRIGFCLWLTGINQSHVIPPTQLECMGNFAFLASRSKNHDQNLHSIDWTPFRSLVIDFSSFCKTANWLTLH